MIAFAAALFSAALVLDVAGDCPSAASMAIDPAIARDFDVHIVVQTEDTRLVIEMFDAENATLRATKTIDGRLSCAERADAVAVVIETWSLELAYRAPAEASTSETSTSETSTSETSTSETSTSETSTSETSTSDASPAERSSPTEKRPRAELPRPTPRRAVLPATPPPEPAVAGRWVAGGLGVAVLAGVLSLNIASPHDRGLDQPTDFIPALLYIAGISLITAAIAGD